VNTLAILITPAGFPVFNKLGSLITALACLEHDTADGVDGCREIREFVGSWPRADWRRVA
jgi:hypothetical protein